MGLTNAQYNAIMRDYQRRQNRSLQEQARRAQEIYDRIPEYAQIEAQIAAASTACARELLRGEADSEPVGPDGASDLGAPGGADMPEHTLRDLRARIAGLSQRKAVLLREAGYPPDYLLPQYCCPDCQDTGYIGQQKCHCFCQAVIDLLYTQSNLRDSLGDEDFASFSLEYYPEHIKDPVTGQTAAQTAARALSECKRFVREFDDRFENIFLYGDTGLGKTFLSHCIARELLDSAHSVIYFSAFRLFELFADSAFGRSENMEEGELERHIFTCDFLIIDDLGTELTNSFVSSQLFLILNERILRRKSTLISTNLSLATFADTYSERVFSRISSQYLMLKLIGDDIRLQKKIKHIGPG